MQNTISDSYIINRLNLLEFYCFFEGFFSKRLKFEMAHHARFVARTVIVKDGNVDGAVSVLNRIMSAEGIFTNWRRRRFYEKPWQARRRVNVEICQAIYNEDMSNKITFTMRKNREEAWPGC
ncbi:28S ribosomal protein S21, mitochondrial, partial [Stegodyphus mimosarum]